MSKLIAISGCPGTGKTTLARGLGSQIRYKTKFKTVELVCEWARTFIYKYEIKNVSDQYLIMEKQLKDEANYPPTTDVVVTDSPVFYSFLYGIEVADNSVHDAKVVSELFHRLILLPKPHYDIVFHLNPILKPVQDGVRSSHQFEDEWRNEFNEKIKSLFSLFKPKHFVIVPDNLVSLQDRIDWCTNYINTHD